MRILVSNPDTIGDLVLRQPLFRALADAGHDLMLVVRPLLEPVVPLVAPGARVAVAPEHIYRGSLEPQDASLGAVAAAARDFAPDLLIIAPYQWTVLEERLALSLPDARCIAMSGRLFAEPGFGPSPPSVIRPTVEVAEDSPEAHKYSRLASAILGRARTLPDPLIRANDGHRIAAEAELGRLGLAPGEYWAACIGHSEHTYVRNWRPEHWAALLAGWAKRHGRRFLLVGSHAESASAERTRALMGDAAPAAFPWFGSGHGAIDALIGLIDLSRGYVGRDTGPMHLAAALGKPVLAVFGGGTWPRFLPAADASVSITISVPCSGCGWVCHLPESYCVKEVPLAPVEAAADELEADRVRTRSVRALPPDAALLSRIAREGGAAARERLVQLSVARRRAEEVELSKANENGSGAALDAPYAVAGAASPRTWAALPDADAVRTELDQTRQALATARARIAQLEANAQESAAFRARQAAQITSTREYVAELKARIAVLEKRFEERTGELMAAKADLADARAQIRLEGVASRQVEGLKAELDKCRAEIAVRVREAVDNQERIKSLCAQVAEASQFGSAEHRKRESLLIEKLNEARRNLTAAEGRLADLRRAASRAEAEKTALAELTRQQDEQLATLRVRVRDLAISRWRRLGQRLRLAMELPWEHEYRNGSLRAARPAPTRTPVDQH